MRNTADTLAWYSKNKDNPPFDPDGMCLKICRTARDISALFPSAVAAQNATPMADRVTKVSDITAGMVGYSDDPHDSNPFGHIYTYAGWATKDPTNDLGDLIVWTNSVKANRIVAVRGDYFQRFWGDAFQFAATSLNGQDLILPSKPAPPAPPKPLQGGKFIRESVNRLREARDVHKARGDLRMAQAIQRDINRMKKKYNL